MSSIAKSANFINFWTQQEGGSYIVEYFGKGDRFIRSIQEIQSLDGRTLFSLGDKTIHQSIKDLEKYGEFSKGTNRLITVIVNQLNELFIGQKDEREDNKLTLL